MTWQREDKDKEMRASTMQQEHQQLQRDNRKYNSTRVSMIKTQRQKIQRDNAMRATKIKTRASTTWQATMWSEPTLLRALPMQQEHWFQDNIDKNNNDATRALTRTETNMSILSNSWAQHLKSLTGNDEANKNMMVFTEALAPSMTISKQLNALVQDVNAAVLLVAPNNSIQRIHSRAKFGGTHSWSNISIVCLIGTGPRVHAVTVNHKQAGASTTTSIPSAMGITNCKTINDFVNLNINMTATASTVAAAAITATPPTARSTSITKMTANATVAPTIATTACRTTKRSTGAVMWAGTTNQAATPTNAATATAPATVTTPRGGGRRGARSRGGTTAIAAPIIQSAAPTSQTIEVKSAFGMAPFLCNTIFNKKTSDPLKLIVLAWTVAIEFNACHQGAAGFANASALDHVAAFTNWALAIHLG
jgi:hypothetical protein